MKFIIKRQLLYSLIIPYIIIGILTVSAHLYMYGRMTREATQNYIEESTSGLHNLMKEIDFEIKDMTNLSLDIAMNNQVNKLSHISLPMTRQDKYDIALAMADISNIKSYNSFIENMYIYFRQGNFVIANSYYYEPEVAYQAFHDKTLKGYEVWREILEKDYPKGQLVDVGGRLVYVSTPSIEVSYNVICLIAESRLKDLIREYEESRSATLEIRNEQGQVLVQREDKGKKGEKEHLVIQVTSDQSGLQFEAFVDQGGLQGATQDIFVLITFSLMIFLASLAVGLGLMKKNYSHIIRLVKQFKLLESERRMPEVNQADEFTYSEVDYMENMLKYLQSDRENQRDIVWENSIRKALNGVMDEELIDRFKNTDKELLSDEWMVGSIEQPQMDKLPSKEKQFVEFAIGNVLEESLEEQAKVYVLTLQTHFVFVINLRECVAGDCLEKVIERLESGKSFLSEHLEIGGTWSVSDQYEGIKALHLAYRQAQRGLEYRLVLGDKHIIHTTELHEKNSNYFYSMDLEFQIINYIKQGETHKALATLDYLFDINLGEQNLDIENIKCFIIDICSTLLKMAHQLKVERIIEPSQLIKESHTTEEIREELRMVVKHLCQQSQMGKRESGWQRGQEIIQYIEAHYQDPNLNVAGIADVFELNASYLSRMFKEHIGENLLTYINTYRIKKAKELLHQTNLTLNEIAEQVGYINSIAIIRSFKKYEAMTPIQYRNLSRTSLEK
ncbi:MAG: helix-turn-helix transcriptional regulator [Cellulosilyticaceae bacterium]